MVTEGKQCSQMVIGPGRWDAFHPTRCQKKATVERDGKLYCTIHDPEYRKKKNRKRREQWDRERAARDAKWDRDTEVFAATEGLTTEELQSLSPSRVRASNAMYEALERIASCQSVIEGDIVDIARKALADGK